MALGKFACFCIEARFGADIPAGVQAALRHYARSLESARTPVAFPGFRRGQPLDGSGAKFELAVEPEIQAALETEAKKQAMQVEQILVHAVFVYLAAMEEPSPTRLDRDNAPLR